MQLERSLARFRASPFSRLRNLGDYAVIVDHYALVDRPLRWRSPIAQHIRRLHGAELTQQRNVSLLPECRRVDVPHGQCGQRETDVSEVVLRGKPLALHQSLHRLGIVELPRIERLSENIALRALVADLHAVVVLR